MSQAKKHARVIYSRWHNMTVQFDEVIKITIVHNKLLWYKKRHFFSLKISEQCRQPYPQNCPQTLQNRPKFPQNPSDIVGLSVNLPLLWENFRLKNSNVAIYVWQFITLFEKMLLKYTKSYCDIWIIQIMFVFLQCKFNFAYVLWEFGINDEKRSTASIERREDPERAK